MSTFATTSTGSAGVQGALWGSRAVDWAECQEPLSEPLFRRLIELAGIGAGTKVLDVGCATGCFARLAAEAGAEVTGFDASEQLIEIARTRVPEAELVQGDLESLPFPGAGFDVVSGFNAFQYAASPPGAVGEAKRVARPGGTVAAAVWGRADQCEAATYIAALGSLLPPPPPGAPGPFALSEPGALEGLLAEAGLEPEQSVEVVCRWDYASEDELLRGLLSAGPAVRAIDHAGEGAVREAVAESVAPFRRSNGGYSLENAFRLVLAKV